MRGSYRRNTLGACMRVIVVCLAAVLLARPASAQTPGVGLLAQGLVRIFDPDARAFVGAVVLRGVDRVLAVPDSGAVYATTITDTALQVIDTHDLSIVDSIDIGADIGGLTYAPPSRALYLTDQREPNAVVVDVGTSRVAAQLDLGAVGVSRTYDASSGNVLLALPASNQIAATNLEGVLSVADLPGCASLQSLAIDDERHLVFIACQANAQLAIVDLDSMEQRALVDLGRAPWAVTFEPQLHMVYVSCEGGVIFVFREDPLNPGSLQLVTNPVIGPNVHSISLDTATRHVYVPTLDIRGTPVLRELVTRALPDPE
jgi:DNA-binding beta-propeller fold protein YncE